jgi:ribosomal protein S18 acetylase RimI-like enzyme
MPENMKVIIKRVTRYSNRVYDSVIRLLPQLDPAYPLPTSHDFKEILSGRNTHFIIAELDSKEIAGILTLVFYKLPTGTKYWIEDVVVDKAHRGKGIGKALVLYAVDIARSMGAKSVDLTSRPFRIAANKLYRDLGFELRETNVYRYPVK